jgi:hypothetical protein
MLDLISVLVTGAIGVFIVGYLTPKFAIWGSIGTAMMWLTAHLVSAFSPDEVLNEIGPHIIDLFLVYPTAIGLAFSDMTASDGLLGGLAVILIALLWLVPYILGLVFGVLTWPELIPFRILL